MSKFKNQKSIFIIQYSLPHRINQIFKILGQCTVLLSQLSNRQNFYTTQLFTKQDCVNVFSKKTLRTNEAENS